MSGELDVFRMISAVDGVAVQAGRFAKGVHIPQHSHLYPHMTFIGHGAVEAWCDGVYMGVFRAFSGIIIAAHKKHLFLTLEDDTVILCVHNASRNGDIEIEEEHILVLEN